MSQPIYIVISQTGTILSRILKLVTRAEYNHVSISLSPDLNTMYSFGRINAYNPFVSGFVQESLHYGTFKRFYNTRAIVLSVNVTPENFYALHKKLNFMFSNKENYRYNYLGLLLAGVRIPYHTENRYYCSEFVKEILINCGVSEAEKLNSITMPIHFLKLQNATEIYCGKLANYNVRTKI